MDIVSEDRLDHKTSLAGYSHIKIIGKNCELAALKQQFVALVEGEDAILKP